MVTNQLKSTKTKRLHLRNNFFWAQIELINFTVFNQTENFFSHNIAKIFKRYKPP